MLANSWEKQIYLYVDDFGRNIYLKFNDYLADAGGLKRARGVPVHGHKGIHHRYVKVRSLEPIDGKKNYAEIPVNVDSPLWTGNLGQIVRVGNYDCETIKKVEEKEYGRAGAAEDRRQLKKFGINPYLPTQQ